MKLRYQYKLRPGRQALALLTAQYDASRWVWNQCVERFTKHLDTSQTVLHRLLTQWRADHEWLAAQPVVPQQQIIRDFVAAKNAFFKKLRKPPRFKAAKTSLPSLNYTLRGLSIRDGRLRKVGSCCRWCGAVTCRQSLHRCGCIGMLPDGGGPHLWSSERPALSHGSIMGSLVLIGVSRRRLRPPLLTTTCTTATVPVAVPKPYNEKSAKWPDTEPSVTGSLTARPRLKQPRFNARCDGSAKNNPDPGHKASQRIICTSPVKTSNPHSYPNPAWHAKQQKTLSAWSKQN